MSGALRQRLLALLISLLITVTATSAALMMPKPRPLFSPGLRQLTSGPYNDRYPVWSPDGRFIAYVSDREGVESIWVIKADGTSNRRISPKGLLATYPSWAPDSMTLAYWGGTGDSFALYIVSVGDESTRKISPEYWGRPRAQARWSPDGTRLLFLALSDHYDLLVLDVRSGATEALVQVQGDYAKADWMSSDKIVFSTLAEDLYEIKTIDLTTHHVEALFSGSANYYSPAAAPQASLLAFFSNRSVPYESLIPGFAGANLEQVIVTMMGGPNLWLSDYSGANLSFQHTLAQLWRETPTQVAVPYSPGDIEITFAPVWNIEGNKVAFVAYDVENGLNIYVWDTVTSSTVHVGPYSGDSVDPCWSPIAPNVVFSNRASGYYHIYIAYSVGMGSPQTPTTY
jgi:Tol biopolymer transport system component